MTTYTPEQEVAWIRKIIRSAALDEYRRWRRWNRELLILNAPLDDEDDRERIDTIAVPEPPPEHVELRWLIEQLPERERTVIWGLYFEGRNQREIASYMSISQMTVSKLHRAAVQRLREWMQE
ncbi:sigma-70 family RNA polymerase sigma factor [Alicyclobacillus sendaiensis]|uniref:sigma-70 family RNA polymerase sigma factor n=1 Tax=Alicyclobacillus sendaiensis TaxID=192387 RepID=UPI0026F46E3F|nr:sigma-70 family RNA polymerase sigma factor [Alicyclobacillus sendaiensis]